MVKKMGIILVGMKMVKERLNATIYNIHFTKSCVPDEVGRMFLYSYTFFIHIRINKKEKDYDIDLDKVYCEEI